MENPGICENHDKADKKKSQSKKTTPPFERPKIKWISAQASNMPTISALENEKKTISDRMRKLEYEKKKKIACSQKWILFF